MGLGASGCELDRELEGRASGCEITVLEGGHAPLVAGIGLRGSCGFLGIGSGGHSQRKREEQNCTPLEISGSLHRELPIVSFRRRVACC